MSANPADLFLPYHRLPDLFKALCDAGYSCIGPQVRDGAIVYDVLNSMEQLPWGVRDRQSNGSYQLETIPEHKAFAFANGPQAIKPILFKPQETVWKVRRNPQGHLQFEPQSAVETPVAIIGARACDLAAMKIQDAVFLQNNATDVRYQKRREQLFVVAVNCVYASSNCFCVSAGSGPEVSHSYDVVMTEVEGGLVVKSGSERGEAILSALQLPKAKATKLKEASDNVAVAAAMQTKRIPFNNQRPLKDLLFSNLNHPQWEDVAKRCLSCGNCTAVCPTCFCHSAVEKPSLDGTSSEHVQEWDSCFTKGHSYLSKKVIRDDVRKRYRQWLTHKVGSWFDQFGSSGCVGCGRCVSWCPVGIDITEELAAMTGESNVRKIDDDASA